MSAPSAENLFLNLWSTALNDEDGATRPGTKEWSQSRAKQHAYWSSVWEDCLQLSKCIESREEAREKVANIFDDLRMEDLYGPDCK